MSFSNDQANFWKLASVVQNLVSNGQLMERENALNFLHEDVQKLFEVIQYSWRFDCTPVHCIGTIIAEMAALLLRKMLQCHFQIVWTKIGELGQDQLITLLQVFLTGSSVPDSQLHKELIQTCMIVSENLHDVDEWTGLLEFILMEKVRIEEDNNALEILQCYPSIFSDQLLRSDEIRSRILGMFGRTLKSPVDIIRVNAAKAYGRLILNIVHSRDILLSYLLPLDDFINVLQLSETDPDPKLLIVTRKMMKHLNLHSSFERFSIILKTCTVIAKDSRNGEVYKKLAFKCVMTILAKKGFHQAEFVLLFFRTIMREFYDNHTQMKTVAKLADLVHCRLFGQFMNFKHRDFDTIMMIYEGIAVNIIHKERELLRSRRFPNLERRHYWELSKKQDHRENTLLMWEEMQKYIWNDTPSENTRFL